MNSARETGSRPSKGSSRSMTLGFPSRSNSSSRRFLSPLDKVLTLALPPMFSALSQASRLSGFGFDQRFEGLGDFAVAEAILPAFLEDFYHLGLEKVPSPLGQRLGLCAYEGATAMVQADQAGYLEQLVDFDGRRGVDAQLAGK